MFLGDYSGQNNTTGSNNMFLGSVSGSNNTSGSRNVFLGVGAGSNNTTGTGNIYLGGNSGLATNTGWNNIFIGEGAGNGNSNGSYNISAGYYTQLTYNSYNKLNIGDFLYGDILDATIGIGNETPAAALDVVSTGTANNQFAQIWRDSSGVIKSSMSATGVMMATKYIGDGSGLTGISISVSGDNLGNHTATQALNMANNQILNVSSLTVTGKDGSGYSLSLSSGISMPAGTVAAGLFNGSGASLSSLNASNLSNGTIADARLSSNVELLNANQTISGVKTFTSSVTIVSNVFSIGGSTLVVVNGAVGVGTSAPAAKLEISEAGTASSLVIKDDGVKVQEIFDGGIVDFPKQSRMRAYLDSSFTSTNNTLVKVPFSSESYDEQGEFDNSTNYRFTAKKAGFYLISSSLYIENGSWPVRAYMLVKKNGTTTISQSEARVDTYDPTNYVSPTVTDVQYLSANDYVEVYVYVASNGSKTLNGGAHLNWLIIHKLS